MDKQYKQPQEIKVDEPTLNQANFLNESIGALFLDVQAPTTVPTGHPTRLVDQRRFVLVEGSPVNAGSFITGTIYKITTVGTTDFTLIGARANQTNLYFAATGAGSGSGQATAYSVREYMYIPQFRVWKYVTLT